MLSAITAPAPPSLYKHHICLRSTIPAFCTFLVAPLQPEARGPQTPAQTASLPKSAEASGLTSREFVVCCVAVPAKVPQLQQSAKASVGGVAVVACWQHAGLRQLSTSAGLCQLSPPLDAVPPMLDHHRLRRLGTRTLADSAHAFVSRASLVPAFASAADFSSALPLPSVVLVGTVASFWWKPPPANSACLSLKRLAKVR